MEIWVDVPGYSMEYQVSNFGRVRSLSRWKKGAELKPFGHSCGYMRVRFKDCNKYLHRVVADSFIGIPDGMTVNHIDGDKINNRLDNLEVVTFQQNKNHAKINGLVARGEKVKSSKLNRHQVEEIRDYFSIGFSPGYLAELFNISTKTIYSIINGNAWTWLEKN